MRSANMETMFLSHQHLALTGMSYTWQGQVSMTDIKENMTLREPYRKNYITVNLKI
jgi:hypothetical protein